MVRLGIVVAGRTKRDTSAHAAHRHSAALVRAALPAATSAFGLTFRGRQYPCWSLHGNNEIRRNRVKIQGSPDEGSKCDDQRVGTHRMPSQQFRHSACGQVYLLLRTQQDHVRERPFDRIANAAGTIRVLRAPLPFGLP